MRFGVHVSIAGGLDQAVIRAHALGCETFQIFVANPRGYPKRDGSLENPAFDPARVVEV